MSELPPIPTEDHKMAWHRACLAYREKRQAGASAQEAYEAAVAAMQALLRLSWNEASAEVVNAIAYAMRYHSEWLEEDKEECPRETCTPAVEITVMADTWDVHQNGSFKWIRKVGEEFGPWNISGMLYLCPCGCRTIGELRFLRPGETPRSPTYTWDGNREYPTIEPDVTHIVGGKVHWSGCLVCGEWVGYSNAHEDRDD